MGASLQWRYLRSDFISRLHLRILLVLTLLLFLVASLCKIPGIIDHPQFRLEASNDWVKSLITENSWRAFAYYLFFLIDLVWSFALLLVIFKFVKKAINTFFYDGIATEENNGELTQTPTYKKGPLRIFFIIVLLVATVLAWCMDAYENYTYVIHFEYVEAIEIGKYATYGIGVFFLLAAAIYRYVANGTFANQVVPTFANFLKSAFFSLLILAIIGVFLPQAPQVNSIVVNLYDKPYNFLLLLLVAPMYAVMLSHYPTYFNIDEKNRTWYSAEIKLWIFVVVFFKFKGNYKESNSGAIEGYVNILLRSLGVFFYVALFYLIGYASEVNFDWPVSISSISIAILGIGLYLLYSLKKVKEAWLKKHIKYLRTYLPQFYDGDYTYKNREKNDGLISYTKAPVEVPIEAPVPERKSLYEINKYVGAYSLFLIITVMFHLALFIFLFATKSQSDSGAFLRYSNITAILSLICIFLQLVTFIYYRTFRSVFRFVFYISKRTVLNAFFVLREIDVVNDISGTTQDTLDEYKAKFKKFFVSNKFLTNRPDLLFFKNLRFGYLSNNILFLQFMAVTGVVNMVFLVIINIYSIQAVRFNAILIILSYLFFFYGMLVIITKTFIYYKYSNEKNAKRKRATFNVAIVVAVLALILLNRLGTVFPNDLFTANLIERTDNQEVKLETFVDNLSKTERRYYIGSYGGGMKANAWTMTVLKELYDKDASFFEKTMGISGVSGGTMGLTNMAAIIQANPDDNQWQQRITKISTTNILGIDITHILGRDLFLHLFYPFKDLRGYDRSTQAMRKYAMLSGNTDEAVQPTPYRQFWKELYEKNNKKFPVLISNTTNVLGNQGMAVSVSSVKGLEEDSFIYQGADDILEIRENKYFEEFFDPEKKDSIVTTTKTLSFYEAASTSNRFPLISPAIKIETLGHYNDGGIYENSGMLSVLKLFRAINESEGIEDLDSLKQQNIFINIVNDKGQYIRHTVEQFLQSPIQVNKINKNTEINAIINSIASTEMLPIFVKRELSRLASDHENIYGLKLYISHIASRFQTLKRSMGRI